MKGSVAKKVALMGMLAATAIAFSFLEGLLPALPFLPPGAKAGFSNIVVMFALQFFGGPAALCIAVIKSCFVLITRGGSAFFMSLGGGLLATVVMWLCVRCNASFLLMGISGAVAHNCAQLAVALLLTQTLGLVTYLPFLILFALCAGTVTGILFRITYSPLCRVAKAIQQFAPKK